MARTPAGSRQCAAASRFELNPNRGDHFLHGLFLNPPDVWTDREPTLDEEISAPAEGDVFEMANLPPDWTGVLAAIFISTGLGRHGARRRRPSLGVLNLYRRFRVTALMSRYSSMPCWEPSRP